jgi:hypothetical protein
VFGVSRCANGCYRKALYWVSIPACATLKRKVDVVIATVYRTHTVVARNSDKLPHKYLWSGLRIQTTWTKPGELSACRSFVTTSHRKTLPQTKNCSTVSVLMGLSAGAKDAECQRNQALAPD